MIPVTQALYGAATDTFYSHWSRLTALSVRIRRLPFASHTDTGFHTPARAIFQAVPLPRLKSGKFSERAHQQPHKPSSRGQIGALERVGAERRLRLRTPLLGTATAKGVYDHTQGS